MTKQSQPAPTTTRTADDFTAARSLVRKLEAVNAWLANAHTTAELKRQKILESASPLVRAMAAAAMSETVSVDGEANELDGEA